MEQSVAISLEVLLVGVMEDAHSWIPFFLLFEEVSKEKMNLGKNVTKEVDGT
ncbi:hypothetical protein [Thalassobacillus sp. C254]|uniref:hypothetical protein n=1 Tax=Thalassobacillus sp. C254 TaxID=1225341 RepID=UPI0012EDC1D2|nr:hypothetical protein [Thalassobacillus sp. C254]